MYYCLYGDIIITYYVHNVWDLGRLKFYNLYGRLMKKKYGLLLWSLRRDIRH